MLGPLRATVDGVPVVLPAGRRRAVLAVLLLHRGYMVGADALIDAAWGRDLPESPPAALYTVISRLRGILGGQCLDAVPGGYLLDAPPGSTDAERFEELCTRAARSPAEPAARLLDAALGLWRGTAYQEFNDSDFARAEAARLDGLRLDACEERAAIDLELGAADAALARLLPFVKEHPFRERALGLMMSALSRSGRTPEALQAYSGYRKILARELGLDPSPYLEGLQKRILGNTGTTGHWHPGRRNLPVFSGPPVTSFMGREQETARLLDLVATHRLVTVTGPGGVGKTRLVTEALGALGHRTGLAPVPVDLAGVTRPAPGGTAAVGTAVCAALGMEPGTGDDPLEAIAEALRAAPGLLVLDNCEHVRAEVRELAGALARACPDSPLLATSRARLGLAHEEVLVLDPLPVPAPGAQRGEINASAAVQLFVKRSGTDPPRDGAAETVAELVRRLDGLPLAIEQAAGRAAVLGAGPLLERLDRGLDLVAGNGGGRQDSLARVLDYSWELLEPATAQLLESLSVFGGEFDLDAAEAMAPGGGTHADLRLAELVECSMLVLIRDPAGTRYRLLETVRAHAAARLEAAHRTDAARIAHARWAAALAGRFATASVSRGMSGFGRLDRAKADLAAAVRFALDTGRCSLAATITGQLALVPHWMPGPQLWQLSTEVARASGLRGQGAEALGLAAAALAAVQQGAPEQALELAARARGLATTVQSAYLAGLASGIAALYAGRLMEAAAHFAGALQIAGLTEGNRAELHASLALVHCYAGDQAAAGASARAARSVAEGPVHGSIRAFATYASGEVLAVRDPATATAVFREAALRADRIAAQQVGLVARIAWLAALVRIGEHREALDMAGPLLEGLLREGNWPQLWTTVRMLAGSFAATGRDALAEFLLAAADAAPSATTLAGPDAMRQTELRERLRGRLGESRSARIAALAGALPRTDIVHRAWAALPHGAPEPDPGA
ncbi:BTAD domain-containing putative transcriptional regulator [Paeniglutamicibacter psychrophenolicus]|uniref:BTAD domain-containing putative transcriptional regulator n=1 Tax=Paeniglutamicibacter psychrophenolicus TaxID=257454 RepID=UPI0031CF4BF5